VTSRATSLLGQPCGFNNLNQVAKDRVIDERTMQVIEVNSAVSVSTHAPIPNIQ
jgi:hypothetical protein